MDATKLMKTGLLSLALCAGSVLAYETDSLKPFDISRPVPAHLSARARGFDSAPSVTASPGGRLWIAWHSGGTSEGEDNAVLVATSGDGGLTWSEPLFAIDAPGPLRGLDPGLWTDPDGKVWLFYAQVYSYWDGRGGVWAMHPIDPEDADTEWTTPVRLCDGFMKNKPIVDSQGRWLLPVEFMNMDPMEGDAGGLSPMTGETAHPMPEYKAGNLFVSTDKGATVSFLGRSAIPTADLDCTENMVVEREDGTLWMLSRTKYGIGEATSSDGGATWTGTTASAIRNPNSRFFIGRLQSGCLLLVKNGPVNVKTARSQIMAYVSDDDGATWTGGLTLDARENVSYPDAVQDGDGFIHVVHDCNRTTMRQIVHHRFTETDVRAGHLVSVGSKLGDTVAINPAYAPQVQPEASDDDSYVRLEYIDSTKGGGQYIDTEYVLAFGDDVDLRFDLLSVDPNDYNTTQNPPTTYTLFGTRNIPNPNFLQERDGLLIGQDVNSQTPRFFFDYAAYPNAERLYSDAPKTGAYEFHGTSAQRTILQPDESTKISSTPETLSRSLAATAYLFHTHVKGQDISWLPHPQMRFRSLCIRHGAEEHLFLPVLRQSDSKPGVYDAFNSRFLENKGAGADFVSGPTMSLPRLDAVAGEGGRISVNGGLPTREYSSVRDFSALTLRAEPEAGYVFDKWEVTGISVPDPSLKTIAIPMSAGDVSVVAKFVRLVFVDYIDSTKGGGQYIDTGFVMSFGDEVDLRFELLSVDPNDYNATEDPPVTYAIFGARNAQDIVTRDGLLVIQDVNNATPKLMFDYSAIPHGYRLNSDTPRVGAYEFHGTPAKRTILQPDETTVSESALESATRSLSATAYLFHTHVIGQSLPWLPHPQMRFRSLLVRRGDEEHWFFPARTPEGMPGVYDTWERVFLTNKGKGEDFILGPDCASQGVEVVVTTSGEGVVCVNGDICGTSITTNVMFGDSLELSAISPVGKPFVRWSSNVDEHDGNQLPAMRILARPSQEHVSLTAEFGADYIPYSPLEYIDSTKGGGQYIDTEFLNQQGDAVDLRFDLLSTDPADYADDPDVFCIFGSRYKSEAFLEVGHCLPKDNVGILFDYSGGQVTRLSSPSPVVGTYVVQGDGRNLRITNPNGQTVSMTIASPVAFTAGGTAYLFHSHLVEYTNAKWRPHPRMRFRSLSIRRGSEEHRFVPALRQSDSKPGVYDVFNSKFLENKGTGADFETKVTPFSVAVYGAGVVSVNGGAPVTGLTRNLSFYGVDIMARPTAANASCVWVGLPADCYRSENGREVALMEAEAPNVYLDVVTPSSADLVIPAGESEIVATLAGLKSVHVGTPVAGAELASFTLLGQIDVSAANGGYAIVRTEGGKTKNTEIALLNGGRMMLFGDVVVQDVDLPDEKSVLDLNGHTLTIRSQTHRNRKGWSGRVIDSAGGGSVVWKKPGMAILLY